MSATEQNRRIAEYPDWVTSLPEVDVEFPGAKGYLLSGTHGQLVMWEFAAGGSVPTHQHGPQLGVILAGSVLLTREGNTVDYGVGESFSLEDKEWHGAKIAPGTMVLEIFAESDRHRARSV